MPQVAGAGPLPQPADDGRTTVVAVRPRASRRVTGAVVAALLAALIVPGVVRAQDTPSPVATAPAQSAAPTPTPSPPPAPSPTPSAAPTPGTSPEPPDPAATAGTPMPSTPPTSAPTPGPAAVPVESPTPGPAAAAVATPGPPTVISRNVYRAGAAVEQYTGYWCVPASVQTMANLILGTRDTSFATQKLLASVTFRFNRYRYTSVGNDIRGWAGALNWRLPDQLPVVYRDRSYPTRSAALGAIVDAIDETGYPVGITVRHGAHAWSVTGYRISQVPDDPTTRVILGFYVVGPLGSPRDPWPVRFMPLTDFLGQYNRYYEDRKREPWHLDFVLVRPERTTTSSRSWPRP